MGRSQRRAVKVYGKKTCISGASTTAGIFASEDASLVAATPVVKIPSVRHVLDDITNSLSNFRLDNSKPKAIKDDARTPVIEPKIKDNEERPSSHVSNPSIKQVTRPTRSKKASPKPQEDPRLKWLLPLTKEYEKAGKAPLEIHKWDAILDEEWGLEKIAESSYAEVYKVSNCDGTSVLKVMALKPPSGPGSQRETSLDVKSVVSEVLIMDMMAEVPGFLEFKGAHIIEGKPPNAIRGAYDAHAAKNESFFPRPGSYHKDQLFLALELGDAGTDIEHFNVTTISQIWDVFLGVVTALSHGEELASFEHRDLHEGNVCVRRVGNLKSCAPKQRHKFNYSGLEVTLLDYTLSRASQGEATIFRDLEEDPELFHESELLQHQMYRRMRTWAISRAHGVSCPSSDTVVGKSPSSPWKVFMPYTNVIWINYLFNYTIQKYRGILPLSEFLKETKEVREKLDPDRSCFNGGFTCATEVLEYCVRQGWIDEDNLID